MSHVCPTPQAFAFVVQGPIVGKERARIARVRTRSGATIMRAYTPAKTVSAERRVRDAWALGGGHKIPKGVAVRLEIVAIVERPRSHFLSSSELSAEGRRSVFPAKRPDVDNVAKLVMDALNTFAWHDDAQVCCLVTQKEYGSCAELRIGVACMCKTA